MRIHRLLIATLMPGAALAQKAASPDALRPITFLDRQYQRDVGSPTPSPDGKWVLYTLSTADWNQASRQIDIYLVSVKDGLPSTKQMTFTKDKNETSPRWSRDGKFFVFLSNRDAASAPSGPSPTGGGGNVAVQNQIYLMRPDGGEPHRITEAKEGVSSLAFSKDGKWLVYRSGKADEEQLYAFPVVGIDSARPLQITHQQSGVGLWKWSPDSRRIYFVTADTLDEDEKLRVEKKFNVSIRNMATPLSSLWALDVDTQTATRLTRDTAITVTDFNVSDNGRWVGYHGASVNRYMRNITEQDLYSDLYLLDTSTGGSERLTNNTEVAESSLEFSPDSKLIAFSAPDDMTSYSMTNNRVYLRRTDERGGQLRKMGGNFDGDVTIGFWSKDGRTIYFNDGVKATSQLMALDLDKNAVRQVSNVRASLNTSQDDDSKLLLLNYADPRTPPTLFTVPSVDQIPVRANWRQLTDANPQVRNFALGDEEEISWPSADGKPVGGILIKPVGYRPGTRYPLIVAIHGGPASADVLGFNGGYGAQTYAGAGYAVLLPNYRGSTNYGEKHKTDIVGNYFQKGYEDIMTGVDYLIAQGIVDSTKMGVLGWSAGGHWSNWILTHTTRFKAISTGAGTSNWISMYAESDVQRNRQYYLGNKLPYDDFDAYWNQSPLKYIRNAKTPTMIHVVDGDPRVPRPQSEELFMALKRLGVPTELYVYPGTTHGIPDPRNQLLKSVAEMAWMDYWVRGSGKKFAWRDVLKTLDPQGSVATAKPTSN
ncbi:MAG: S9 family peptidase [Gemmatimonadaceae bacterium]